MGLCIDFVQEVETEIGESLTLDHFFLDESIAIMMKYTTPSPTHTGVFIFDQRMPRSYQLNNQSTAEFLRSGQVHRNYIYKN